MSIEWISIDDKLPSTSRDILILYKDFEHLKDFKEDNADNYPSHKNLKICVGWCCIDGYSLGDEELFTTAIWNEGNGSDPYINVLNVIAWAELPEIPEKFQYPAISKTLPKKETEK